MIILETDRLQLREACVDDAAFILRLVNEPAWHKYISNLSINTVKKSSEYIEQKMINMYQESGFGLWITEIKHDSTPIGICGLLKRDSLDDIDLGFAFLEQYWGNGFASEASIAALKYSKDVLKTRKVVAITDPSNVRSVNLLKKTGFHYESEFSHPGSSDILSLYANHINKNTPQPGNDMSH